MGTSEFSFHLRLYPFELIGALFSVKQNIVKDKSGALAALQHEKEIPVDVSASAVIDIIDKSTKTKESGQFMSIDGTKIPW
jgi:hypothetical protein